MLTSMRSPGYKRCPSCASRIEAAVNICPICGHEFPVPKPKLEEADETKRISPAQLSPMRLLLSRLGAVLRKLPWGVIGVVAVIAALAIGAVMLLRNSNLLAPPVSSIRVTMESTPAAALTRLVVATSTPTSLMRSSPTSPAPAPAPTSVPATPVPPTEYTVKDGDTCGGIASKNGVTLATFLAINNLNESNCLIHIGDVVKIPASTPTPGPSPTLPSGVTAQPGNSPEATVTLPPQIIIQVKSGDTCGDIAVRNHVPLSQLIEQNGLDAGCSLQIGQMLTVTFATPTPFISPTPIVAQTPTPRAGFDSPQIIGPLDEARISETQDIVTLQWLSLGLLKDDEWYVVQIQPSGAITVPIFETHGTSIKLTRAIFGDQLERSFAWWVQVKRYLGLDAASGERKYTLLSPPSTVHRFTWRRPQVMATATPQ